MTEPENEGIDQSNLKNKTDFKRIIEQVGKYLKKKEKEKEEHTEEVVLTNPKGEKLEAIKDWIKGFFEYPG